MTLALLHASARRLLERWTPPDADAEASLNLMLELLDLGPRVMLRDGHVDHFTASTLVLDSAGERVLLCLHGRLGRWVQVGGHCEPGDPSLAAVALREATEESGIRGLRMLAEPIGLDIHEVHCSAGPSRHFDVRFVAVAPPDAEPRLSAESADLAWFPVGALPAPLASGTAKLVPPALAALALAPRADTPASASGPASAPASASGPAYASAGAAGPAGAPNGLRPGGSRRAP